MNLKDIYNQPKILTDVAVSKSLLNVITSMFKWDGLPDSIRPEYIELYLSLYGQCAICSDKQGDLIAAMVNRGGAPDVYGLGTQPIISTLNGFTRVYDSVVNDVAYGADGERAVLIYNDNAKSPDGLIQIFTQALAEAVTSLYQNIIHSRYTPVFVASSDTVKAAVERNMSDILAGKSTIIAADNILTEIDSGHKTLDTVKFTDVDKQEKIQFIAKTIDDLLRLFLSIYGQAVQGNAKMAQLSVDEANGATSASFIIPEMKYRSRKKAVDLINATFGLTASISYNKPWAVELEKYTEDVEESEAREGAENEA